MAEKRTQKRTKKRCKVRFGLDSPRRVAFTGDVSKFGLYIITAQPERPGSHLQVELTLPNDRQVNVVAFVCWAKRVPPHLLRVANKAGMGVRLREFKSGEEDYRAFIEELDS